MKPRKQWELRPSNAHRWMTCHGQPAAVEGLKDTGNKHADKGTVAHGLLELALRLDLYDSDLQAYEGKLLKGLPAIPVDDTMLRGIGHALDYVRSYVELNPKADFHAETSVQIRFGDFATTGTLDIVLDNLPEELALIDYKNGVVYVEHEDNPQLMMYALGYLQMHRARLPQNASTRVKLVIVQPNAREGEGPVREHIVSLRDFRQFAVDANDAAIAVHKPNPPRTAGEHCRFCRAAGTCAVYAEHVLQQAGLEFANVENEDMPRPKDLNAKETAAVLRAMALMRAWINSVEETAIERILEGKKIPGYKLVNSQPRRKWDDDEAMLGLFLRMKLDLERVAPHAPLSPAQMDRLAKGKHALLTDKQMAKLQPHVTHNPIEPRVAPIDDPRQPYTPGQEFQR